MIYFFILIFFFIYNISLFLIDNYLVFLCIFIFNIIISLLLKLNIKKHINFLYKNLLFILFIVICNILFSVESTILVGIRLFFVLDFTYIMNNIFDNSKIQRAFYYLFYPLKIFKIDINNLTLVIAISLAFIPILSDEALMIKTSLKSKGLEFSLKNIITRPHIYLITYINGVFDRVDELEKSLLIKGY